MIATTTGATIMTSSQARDGEMTTSSAARSAMDRPATHMGAFGRSRAEHGGAGGAVVPTAAPAASNRWLAWPSAVGFVLGLHGTAALPEMTDRRKGTAVDRPVGCRWRSCSLFIRGRFRLFPCGPRALPRFRYCESTKPSSLVSRPFASIAPCHHGGPAPPGLAFKTRRGAWGEYGGATQAGAVRAPAVVK